MKDTLEEYLQHFEGSLDRSENRKLLLAYMYYLKEVLPHIELDLDYILNKPDTSNHTFFLTIFAQIPLVRVLNLFLKESIFFKHKQIG